MKPVAWMWENDAWIGVNNFSEEKPSAYPNAIPLYTAPRELSDEGKLMMDFIVERRLVGEYFIWCEEQDLLKKASDKC